MQTIYNTDCFEIFKILEDKSVDLTLTDIPYGAVNRKSNGLRNLDKHDADIVTFDLDDFLTECIRVTNGTIYIFCDWEQISQISTTFKDNKLSTRLCVWKKTNPSPMNGQHVWLSGVEVAMFGKKKNATFNEHCHNAVWEFPSGRGKQHPTEKPLKLMKYLVETSSKVGDTVFDPCMGSGVVGKAAKELDRDFIGVEIKPEWFELAKTKIYE